MTVPTPQGVGQNSAYRPSRWLYIPATPTLWRVTDDCIICQKHRGEGPLTGQLIARVGAYEIWSARTDEDGRAPLGYLFIESESHVQFVTDLSDEDAAALGLLRTDRKSVV